MDRKYCEICGYYHKRGEHHPGYIYPDEDKKDIAYLRARCAALEAENQRLREEKRKEKEAKWETQK